MIEDLLIIFRDDSYGMNILDHTKIKELARLLTVGKQLISMLVTIFSHVKYDD